MQYLVIVEKGNSGWSAYVPDLPGCVAAADSRDDTLKLMKEAIEFHVEGMREAGESIPQPISEGAVVDADISAA